MKRTILFSILTISVLSCQSLQPTSRKYFNCQPSGNFNPVDDKHALIYQILKKALIEDKDIPDYRFIEDKDQIYIVDNTPENFFRLIEEGVEVEKQQLSIDDVPSELQGVKFCVKSSEELANIASHTDDFIYIAIGGIKVDGKIGRIGISTNWQTPTGSSRVYLSGGGYIAEYVKEGNAWKFSSILQSWQQ